MLSKTHLAIGMFAAVFFLPHMNNKFVFFVIVLISSVLADIDSAFSMVGKNRLFRIIQFFTKHRGIFHSFSFCLIASVFLAFFYPVFAFPFFLGYGLHLIADSWTVEGIRPFWPLKMKASGKLRVGGVVEHTIFVVLVIVDILLLASYFLN